MSETKDTRPLAERLADYKPNGKGWFHAKSIAEMQYFYFSRLPAIREAAHELGYAIGLHGSTRRDLDLMAMPWRDDPADKEVLAHAIAKAACGLGRDGAYQWEAKPLGRFATSIPICWIDVEPRVDGQGMLDLSVMPALAAAPPADEIHAYAMSIFRRAEAARLKAQQKFPQPNYVALKVAEEAGEVVRGAVHYREGRLPWEELEGEVVQTIAMCLRLLIEGDYINGIFPPKPIAEKLEEL